MKKHCGYATRAINLINLIHKAPRTCPELERQTGMSEEAVAHWIKLLEAGGLITLIGKRGPARLYGWVRIQAAVLGAAA